MPPNNVTTTTFVPTPSETTLMLAAIENAVTEGSFKCNWQTIATKLGYSHAKSASDQFYKLRKRIEACDKVSKTPGGIVFPAKSATPKKTATPTPASAKKRKRSDSDDDADGVVKKEGGSEDGDKDC